MEVTSYAHIVTEIGWPAENFTADMEAGEFHDKETPLIVATLA